MVDVLAQETHIEHMNDENMDVQEPHEGDGRKPKEEPETPMEEGELPEEGEITDEDETPAPNRRPTASAQHPWTAPAQAEGQSERPPCPATR
ncbi:hypothetical protein M3Y99_01768400 [Aphelenchoides fujianensis]|nr:hypothetical protein M3Y99_01768400 [Aphelenchoides fujianensis]